MKATGQYFSVVLFIMLYKVVLNFESVDEILKCDHSNESYWAVFSCGALLLNHLNWPLLEHRRKVNRLTLMYKTLHGHAAINIPPYVKHKTVMKTRNSDPMKFIPIQTSCDEYKYSSWPRTINDWNSLPPNIINMTSISNFKAAVNDYISALSSSFVN